MSSFYIEDDRKLVSVSLRISPTTSLGPYYRVTEDLR
jgi:hypothetical protein